MMVRGWATLARALHKFARQKRQAKTAPRAFGWRFIASTLYDESPRASRQPLRGKIKWFDSLGYGTGDHEDNRACEQTGGLALAKGAAMDIISQMTLTDWMLVVVTLGLTALTAFIVYLIVEDPIKSLVKHLRTWIRRDASRDDATGAREQSSSSNPLPTSTSASAEHTTFTEVSAFVAASSPASDTSKNAPRDERS